MSNVVDLAAIHATAKLRDSLAKNDKGTILATVANLIAILRFDPELHGMIQLDEFSCATMLMRAVPLPDDEAPPMPAGYPREIGPADFSLLHAYIQRAWVPRANVESLHSAIGAAAALDRFHPVADWLGAQVWDGVKRLDRWLTTVFGAPDDPYHRAIGAKFLIGAARRIRSPGCKMDNMLVIEGPQNLGKSSVVRELFTDPWFSDSLAHNLAGKDAAIGLRGRWGIELAEIDQIVRNDVETFKAFVTRQVDIYRPPYGRADISYPRQCVIVGTTNRDDYLRDETGNRRTWVLAAKWADVEWMRVNRDQLWAEAAAREAGRETIWLDDPTILAEATRQQAERLETDVWDDPVRRFVEFRESVSMAEIMTEALHIPLERQGMGEQRRVGKILRRGGWTRMIVRDGTNISRAWRRGVTAGVTGEP
jgi:putative DNA primase/helicase